MTSQILTYLEYPGQPWAIPQLFPSSVRLNSLCLAFQLTQVCGFIVSVLCIFLSEIHLAVILPQPTIQFLNYVLVYLTGKKSWDTIVVERLRTLYFYRFQKTNSAMDLVKEFKWFAIIDEIFFWVEHCSLLISPLMSCIVVYSRINLRSNFVACLTHTHRCNVAEQFCWALYPERERKLSQNYIIRAQQQIKISDFLIFSSTISNH